MSETPPRPRTATPLLGDHSEPVLTAPLGKSENELVELALSGVLK